MTERWPAVVVGGGITGLYAAHLLASRGLSTLVLDAACAPGGQIRSATMLGHVLELGAESLHGGAPGLLAFAERHLGAQELVEASDARSLVGVRRRGSLDLRPLPNGMGPAGPTRLRPLATSGILSPRGLARAALEPFVPPLRRTTDVAVGELLRARFGAQLTCRLLDPVLGNLHAGDVDRLSLRATAPQLARTAQTHRSLLLARRGRGQGGPPRFLAVRGGLSRLVHALAASPGVTLRRASPVRRLERIRSGHLVHGDDGGIVETERLVLAVPADVGGELLDTWDPGLDTTALHRQRRASVASVLVAYDRAETTRHPAFTASGILLPRDEHRLLKAATFLSTKWPHLSDDTTSLVRLSAGRVDDSRLRGLDDGEVTARLLDDLHDLLGRELTPRAAHVHRWPDALPQLEVGHVDRIGQLRHRLRRRPGLALAGAAYDGLGLAACERSATAAVAEVAPELADTGAR